MVEIKLIAYVRLYKSNVASGATPIGSAAAHPIEQTTQTLEGFKKSSHPKDPKEAFRGKYLKDKSHYKGVEENFHYKGSNTVCIQVSIQRTRVHWIEGISYY